VKITKHQELTDEELAAIYESTVPIPSDVATKIQFLIEKYQELRQHHVDETTELWRRIRSEYTFE
jgi:hypothetical protein